jgi:hypothetical protein
MQHSYVLNRYCIYLYYESIKYALTDGKNIKRSPTKSVIVEEILVEK